MYLNSSSLTEKLADSYHTPERIPEVRLDINLSRHEMTRIIHDRNYNDYTMCSIL